MTDWPALTRALSRTMRDHVPGWTDHNESDPGISLLELMAHLAEGLRLYGERLDRRSPSVSRIIEVLQGLGAEAPADAAERWSGTKRPRYFHGRLLTADVFVEEQEYHLGKHRRHLETLHGYGVVHGLQVKPLTDQHAVIVEPGLALDPQGREILLCESVSMTIPSDSPSPAWLVLEYVERLIDPVPGSNDDREASRIEEGCRVLLTPAPSDSAVAIARLIRDEDNWRVDRAFVPSRLRL